MTNPRPASSPTAASRGGAARGVIAGVVTLAACAAIYFSLVPVVPRIDTRPHQALGQALAAEALKLQQPGGRIILITRDTELFKAPAVEAQVEGLQSALRNAGAKIADTRSLKVDPLRVVSVPPGEFFDLLRKTNERDVIISLLGPPVLDDGQLTKLNGNRARVVAVCSGAMPLQVNLGKLFDQKLLDLAVISRNVAATAAGGFDQHFKLVTAANLNELPLSRPTVPGEAR